MNSLCHEKNASGLNKDKSKTAFINRDSGYIVSFTATHESVITGFPYGSFRKL